MLSFLRTIILSAGILLLGGCLIPLPPTEWAELRVSDTGQSELLLMRGMWQGGITTEGWKGYKEGPFAWCFLQGTGPVYINPTIQPNHRPFTASLGTITIDAAHKKVVIDLHSNDPINGTYRLETVKGEPLYIYWSDKGLLTSP
jgi:hypothetical protein